MGGVVFAFLLTLAAGLFTGVGGLIVLFCKKHNPNFLAICLSFSAGVMIYISFVEIFAKALESLQQIHDETWGMFITALAFFGGIVFIALIDRFIPQPENDAAAQNHLDKKSLRRMGMMTALAIAIHNFPEGLVTFIAALQNPAMGIAIAVSIALHNIPEGIAIAVPMHFATGSKKKALLAAVASGITEPLGALVAYFLLLHWVGDGVFGIIFAAVGGIMVYISVKQLLPAAHKYGKHVYVMRGLFAGMAVMALSLVFL